MNHLIEEYSVTTAAAPQSIAASSAATGAFTDMRSRKSFCFTVFLGPVAAGKTVKVELLSSAGADGADPRVEGETVFTAPEGGAAHHVVKVVGHTSPLRGRWLSVRITNQGTAALLASAALLTDYGWYPEDTGGTTLVV